MSDPVNTSAARVRAPLAHPDRGTRNDAGDRSSLDPAAPPAAQTWIKVMLGAFVPVGLALFLPQAWKLPLLALTAVLFVAGLVMLVRQERHAPPARHD